MEAIKKVLTPTAKENEDEIIHYEVQQGGTEKKDQYEEEQTMMTEQEGQKSFHIMSKSYKEVGQTQQPQVKPSERLYSSTSSYMEKQRTGADVKTTYPYGAKVTTRVISGAYTHTVPPVQYKTSSHYIKSEAKPITYSYAGAPQTVQTYKQHFSDQDRHQTTRLISSMSQDIVPQQEMGSVEFERRMSHLSTTMQHQTSQKIETQQQTFSPEDLEAAIACGRVYAPPNAAFVPGEVVKRAGMVTLYDSGVIPTFENELEVTALPRPLVLDQMKSATTTPLIQEAAGVMDPKTTTTGIIKRVTQARRRMRCC